MKVFKSECGTPCSFRWWIRWHIAKWHWKKWLEYRMMPSNINDTDDMEKWDKYLYKICDRIKK